MGPQHGCHILPTMPDARLVHLGPKRGRSEIVKDQGTGTRAGGKRGNPPPPGRRAGAGSEGRGSLVLLRHILHYTPGSE